MEELKCLHASTNIAERIPRIVITLSVAASARSSKSLCLSPAPTYVRCCTPTIVYVLFLEYCAHPDACLTIFAWMAYSTLRLSDMTCYSSTVRTRTESGPSVFKMKISATYFLIWEAYCNRSGPLPQSAPDVRSHYLTRYYYYYYRSLFPFVCCFPRLKSRPLKFIS